MSAEKLPTQFAPAERESMQVVQDQNENMAEISYVQEILDAVPDLLLILNDKRQAVFCNQILLNYLDKDLDQVLGYRPGEIFCCIHAKKSEGGCGTSEFCRTCNALKSILASQKGKMDVSECRLSTRTENDEIQAYDLQVWATPLDYRQKRYCIFVLKDISHEKRRRVLEKLFFHDILNAAGSIKGFIELIKHAKPEEASDMVETVSLFIHSMVDEIEAQKQLAAAESNELQVQTTEINTGALVDDLIKVYNSHEQALGSTIVKDKDFQEVDFISDQRLITRVLGNMLKNALEAASSGSTITIGCNKYEKDKAIEFWVHNPGYIPRNVQLQIFQRSFSTKDSSRGLGTYSIRMFSESYLQGKVYFRSSQEKGTTFYAKYPLSLE